MSKRVKYKSWFGQRLPEPCVFSGRQGWGHMAFKGICDKTVFLKPPALCRTATATKGVGNAVLLQHLLDMLGKAVSGLNTRLLLLFVLGGCGSRPLHGRTPSMGWRRWHDWGVSRLHTWMFLQHIIDGQQRFTSTTISPWWPGTSLGTCLGFGFRLSLGACLGFGRRFGLGSGFCLALALRFGLRFGLRLCLLHISDPPKLVILGNWVLAR